MAARRPTSALRIAALVKQIPKFEELRLGPDGRLVRDGKELHLPTTAAGPSGPDATWLPRPGGPERR